MKVVVLKEGIHTRANPVGDMYMDRIDPICSSVTLIKKESEWEKNILVDTGYYGYEQEILDALKKEGIKAEEIQIVINTHEHFDHCANNYLFRNAIKIVGIMQWDQKNAIDVFKGINSIKIQEGVSLIWTPGHKQIHTSVIIKADKTYVVAGDTIAKDFHLSSYEGREKLDSAKKVLEIADIIIPGHGPIIHKEDFEEVQAKIKEYEDIRI
jgi:glyoxylase-like metal-dependent hydrolase (beta-lactamase superfamily II)